MDVSDMRYLAIDLGSKRTGLAIGDDGTCIPSPLDTLVTTSDAHRMAKVMTAIEAHEPDALVVGLPLNMDGTEGPAAEQAAAFAEAIAERSGLNVHLVDERMTSQAADDQMAQSGLTHKQKKARRDSLAAATILQDFFDRTVG